MESIVKQITEGELRGKKSARITAQVVGGLRSEDETLLFPPVAFALLEMPARTAKQLAASLAEMTATLPDDADFELYVREIRRGRYGRRCEIVASTPADDGKF